MTPYTPAAVATIRSAINSGQDADYVRRELGWPASMFDSICRRHGIEARSAAAIVDVAAPSVVRAAPATDPDAGTQSFTLKLDHGQIGQLAAYAQRHGLSRSAAAMKIVDDYLARNPPRDIEPIDRKSRGSGVRVKETFVRISDNAARILFAEAKVRGKTSSIGRLVKAIIVHHFESSP